MLVNPFKLWLALARLPIDAWLSWQYWTPARKAANGYGLSWGMRPWARSTT